MEKDIQLARSFRAISHPSRARLFRLLSENPMVGSSFASLQSVTGFGDATLTHHLREMEQSGLVRRRKRGPFTEYRLETAAFTRALTQAQGLATSTRLRALG